MDIQTFEEEVLKNERLLYRVSWSMLSNQEDCADAVQEALARAWQRRDTLRSARAFRGWLVQILSNVCKDMLRRRQRQSAVPLEGDILDTLASDTSEQSMDEALQTLTPEQRTIMVLYYVEGYKVRDIAGMLDLSVSTVKTRMMHARGHLRAEADGHTVLHGGM